MQLTMTLYDLATQLKQIYITSQNLIYLTETLKIWSKGLFDIIEETTLTWSNLTQLAMTYNYLATL